MSISLSFPVLPPSFLFSPCVARCAFSSPPWNTGVGEKRKKERTKKGRDSRPPRENLQRALLNKVFKYYPKLKDIHTCLKSSPPLPFSLFLFLSTVAGVGWFPWWPSCTAQPGAPSGFFFFIQVWLSDGSDRICATLHMNSTIKKRSRMCFRPKEPRVCVCVLCVSVCWLIIHHNLTNYVTSLLLKPSVCKKKVLSSMPAQF